MPPRPARGNSTPAPAAVRADTSDEIADLVRDSNLAEEISDLVQSNKRMLIGVSHDLRSPIARIRGGPLAGPNAPEEERAELLERIELELLRLNGMIEVLTVARLGERADGDTQGPGVAEPGAG